MPEHIPAHIGLHSHAHQVAVILHKVVHPHLYQVQNQQNCRTGQQRAEHLIGDVHVEHISGDNRVNKVDHRHQKGSHQVLDKHLFMGLVVLDKLSEHVMLPPFYTQRKANTCPLYPLPQQKTILFNIFIRNSKPFINQGAAGRGVPPCSHKNFFDTPVFLQLRNIFMIV